MKLSWIPVVGAIAAFVAVKMAGGFFGLAGSLVALGVLAAVCGGLHLAHQRRIRRLCERLEGMDAETRAEVVAELEPELRRTIKRALHHRDNA